MTDSDVADPDLTAPEPAPPSVLARLLAAGITEDRAHAQLAQGVVRVDGKTVTTLTSPRRRRPGSSSPGGKRAPVGRGEPQPDRSRPAPGAPPSLAAGAMSPNGPDR